MAKSKMANFLVIGAIVGLALSMTDKRTRNSVVNKSKEIGDSVHYYKNNREELIEKTKEQAKKAQAIYSRIQEDSTYVTEKINDLKSLAPPVKDMISETKSAFGETKDAVVKVKDDVTSVAKKDADKF